MSGSTHSAHASRASATDGSRAGCANWNDRGSSGVCGIRDHGLHDDPRSWSHLRIATKYPEITRRHFAARGVQAECIKLNGAIELAPLLGLCRHIVDLVQTGATLHANGLVEVEHIADVSARLIVNRPALKTRPDEVGRWIDRFGTAILPIAGNRPRAAAS